MNAIKREIARLAPQTEVKVLPYDHNFMDEVLAFEPDLMLTFPMTSVGLAAPYYVFKHLFGTKVVCFRAEGIVDPASPQSVSNHIGYDRYGPKLVDYELFWGPGPAKLIGDALVACRKLSSASRVKCFGYPRLERYFGVPQAQGNVPLPDFMQAKLAAYGRERTILFATGFHFANYTREMIFAAKDLDAENRCDWLLEMIEEVKRFRATWLAGVRRAAEENPDSLFVLKKHPIERKEDYAALEEIPNVLHVWQDVDIGDLLERSAFFFHYGSTSLADAYLAKVPAVYVYGRSERCREWFPDMGWPSALAVASDRIPETVKELLSSKAVQTEHEPTIKGILEFNFNIREGEAYQPSRGIAEFLLQDDVGQRVPIWDLHGWRALLDFYYRKLRRKVGPPVKRALRAVWARLQQ